jgi:hypothetical protein
LQKLLSSAGYCGNEAIPLWLTTWPWKTTLFVYNKKGILTNKDVDLMDANIC